MRTSPLAGLLLLLTTTSVCSQEQPAAQPVKAEPVATSAELDAWITTLTAQIAASDETIRRSAQVALVSLGPVAVPALQGIASGQDAERAAQAQAVLDRIERRGATGPRNEGPAPAEGPPPGARMDPLRRVLPDLDLTEEQKAKVEAIRAAHIEKARALQQRVRAGEVGQDEARATRAQLMQELLDQVRPVLSEEQFAKVKQALDAAAAARKDG